jgi:hypothetical protein
VGMDLMSNDDEVTTGWLADDLAPVFFKGPQGVEARGDDPVECGSLSALISD